MGGYTFYWLSKQEKKKEKGFQANVSGMRLVVYIISLCYNSDKSPKVNPKRNSPIKYVSIRGDGEEKRTFCDESICLSASF
mmetsp:Transcript_399/g.1186  ORF Transcript_399/g.1186 Transcript_399/m.1186 type:complete len:81 (+) Transcript_399:3890-4132(+)